jgi:hypothetical protein
MRRLHHIDVDIERPYAEVYAFLVEPSNFAQWATGLAAGLVPVGDDLWHVDSPMGAVLVRFTAGNAFGVLDHTVIPAAGPEMTNPMRAIPNGSGTTVVFTLVEREGMTEAEVERDADWVRRDLEALKALLEASSDLDG